ncbi:MAG TPA: hypothetical protein VGJ60_15710 [Chloroflexota bacterium]|jgi:hypothetical protein
MATSLFSRIDSGLDTSGVATALTEGIDRLGNAKGLLDGLTAAPADALAQMTGALQAISVPELDSVKGLVVDFQSLNKQIPSNAAELTGPLETGLTGLVDALGSDLIGPLSTAVDSIRATIALLPQTSTTPLRATPLTATRTPMTLAAAATSSPVVDAVSDIGKVLDGFPSPLTVESFLVFMRDLFKVFPSELLPTNALPVVTEFQQRLDTLLQWRDLDALGLSAAIRATLESLAQFIRTSILTDALKTAQTVQNLTSFVPLEALRDPMQSIEQGLRELATVVTSGNPSTVDARLTQLNAHVSQVNAVLASLDTQLLDREASSLVATLQITPTVLDNRMRETLAVLHPPRDLNPPDPFGNALGDLFNPADADALLGSIEQMLAGLQRLVDTVNLQAIREPLLQAASAAHAVVADLDNVLVEVTTKTSVLFDDVRGLLDKLDVDKVSESVEQALADVREAIRSLVTSLFTPVATAITAAVATLSSGVSAIGVDDIVTAVRNVVERFGDILGDPEVVGALNAARASIDQATTALDGLSFTTVTDQVVADIDKVTTALKKIDPNALPDAVRGQLKSAVAVLPTDFDPIVETITSKFDDLIASGPEPFLLSIQDKPDQLAARVQDFAPKKLIGDKLAAPYQSLIQDLADFQPSQLLKPVQDSLDDLTDRLQALDPAALLAPLDTLHADLVSAFAKLDPAELIQPVSDKLSGAIDLVVSRLPTDDLVSALDPALGFLQTLIGGLDAVRTVLQKLKGMLDGLTSPEQQVQALLDPILTRLGQLPDPTPLEQGFAAIRAAVGEVTAAGLRQAVLVPVDSLQARLNELDPTRVYGGVVRAYRDFPTNAIDTLPQPQRGEIRAFLDVFDPSSPAFARPFSQLQTWRTQLADQRTRLDDFLAGWDALYHRSDGPFSEFLRDNISVPDLRDLLAETVTSSFAGPMKLLFGLMEQVGGLVGRLVDALAGFVEHVQSKLADLLLVPQALTAVQAALQELVATLQAFDLSFLTNAAQQVFADLRTKLDDLDPARIRAAVQATFDELVGALKLEALLPPNALQQLDHTYQQVVDTLRGVDPTRLIVDEVQPEFETAVKPLLDVVFSLSKLIKALLQRLDALGAELDQGLSRTGDAFEKMVQAIPA